ncbi:MAG: hypothetical protein WAM11_05590 [Cyanobium sp.]
MPYALFPELGALGWVTRSNPRHPWARSPALLMLTPFLTGLLGLAIRAIWPLGPWPCCWMWEAIAGGGAAGGGEGSGGQATGTA